MRLVVAVAAMLAAAGCGVPEERAAVEALARDYFECIRRKDFEGTRAFHGPQFYQNMTPDKWLEMVGKVNTKLGDLQSYRLVGWNFRKLAGTDSGIYWELQYETRYAKYRAQEVLVAYKPLKGGEFQIIGHNINSEGLVFE